MCCCTSVRITDPFRAAQVCAHVVWVASLRLFEPLEVYGY